MTIRNFRYLALTEATSFLILLVFSAIKNTGGSEVGVQILGPIHGLLFIGYIAMAFGLRAPAGWSNKVTVWIVVGAVLPFGGFVVDRWLGKRTAANATAG
jgi:integral membrane protein